MWIWSKGHYWKQVSKVYACHILVSQYFIVLSRVLLSIRSKTWDILWYRNIFVIAKYKDRSTCIKSNNLKKHERVGNVSDEIITSDKTFFLSDTEKCTLLAWEMLLTYSPAGLQIYFWAIIDDPVKSHNQVYPRRFMTCPNWFLTFPLLRHFFIALFSVKLSCRIHSLTREYPILH
jgi:hypothetical protein